MNRFLIALAVAVVAGGVAVAAVAQRNPTRPPTTASLTPAYVEAARYWSAGTPSQVAVNESPPTTASLMTAYVQAASVWRR